MGRKTLIIAEAGVNHNGSVDMALELVDVAADAGADAVKFQTFRADHLVSKDAPKAEYQKSTTSHTESQYEMLKKLELSPEDHDRILDRCRMRGIEFISTPFDRDSVDLLADHLQVRRLKISSGDLTNAPLLLHIARKKKPIILSTGMGTLGEIEIALQVLAFGLSTPSSAEPSPEAFLTAYYSSTGREALKEYVSLLHCTTEYPAPFADVNLKVMDTLYQAFDLPTGLSDHTPGIAVPIAAVARGATIIEKHFTLDKTLPGPDHAASLEPQELKGMIESIRQVELAVGGSVKVPADSEIKNLHIVRKSLVAARDIAEGEVFSEENLTVKRPGNGFSPLMYWQLIGTQAPKSFAKDEVIRW
jgi:N-acetylneuraminate synthase